MIRDINHLLLLYIIKPRVNLADWTRGRLDPSQYKNNQMIIYYLATNPMGIYWVRKNAHAIVKTGKLLNLLLGGLSSNPNPESINLLEYLLDMCPTQVVNELSVCPVILSGFLKMPGTTPLINKLNAIDPELKIPTISKPESVEKFSWEKNQQIAQELFGPTPTNILESGSGYMLCTSIIRDLLSDTKSAESVKLLERLLTNTDFSPSLLSGIFSNTNTYTNPSEFTIGLIKKYISKPNYSKQIRNYSGFLASNPNPQAIELYMDIYKADWEVYAHELSKNPGAINLILNNLDTFCSSDTYAWADIYANPEIFVVEPVYRILRKIDSLTSKQIKIEKLN